jgi:hypothetical protein
MALQRVAWFGIGFSLIGYGLLFACAALVTYPAHPSPVMQADNLP